MRGLKVSYCPIFVQLVEWAPADAVAQAFVDLVVSREPLPTVVNLVHPQAVPWSQALGDINNQLSTPLPVIPFSEWISKLEAVSANADAKQLDAVVRVSSDASARNTDCLHEARHQTARILQDSRGPWWPVWVGCWAIFRDL